MCCSKANCARLRLRQALDPNLECLGTEVKYKAQISAVVLEGIDRFQVLTGRVRESWPPNTDTSEGGVEAAAGSANLPQILWC